MYSTCRELPLWNFIEIGETGDLKHLLKDDSEKVNGNELETVYEKILDEYHELTNDDSFAKKNKLRNEIIYFISKVDSLCALINILDSGVLLIDTERDLALDICLRYKTKFDVKSLKRSIAGAKNKLSLKQIEYERGSAENKIKFDEFFVSIQKVYGMTIDKRKTSVSEWVAIVNGVANASV